MIVLQIAFVAVNILVPYFIWRGSKPGADTAQIEWTNTEVSMKRSLNANGGFSCPTGDILKDLVALCQKSQDKLEDGATEVFEQVIGETVISCEVRPDGTVVTLRRESQSEADLSCAANDSAQTLQLAPTFLYDPSGALNSISFTTGDALHTVPIQNCRNKLKRAKTLSSNSLDELASVLGQDAGDPSDLIMANKMCVIYDPAQGWRVWRKKFGIALKA